MQSAIFKVHPNYTLITFLWSIWQRENLQIFKILQQITTTTSDKKSFSFWEKIVLY